MRKAQSEVITTVLIILLVLAAVFIVWTAVKGMINKSTGTGEERISCMGVDLAVAAANPTAKTVSVTRNAGGVADAVVQVILVNGARVTPTSCAPIAATAGLKQLESTVCTLGTLVLGDNVSVGGTIGTVACDATGALQAK